MTLDVRTVEAIDLLKQAEATGRAVFSTSLGLEDQVVTDLTARHAPGIAIFTLDTGRLPAETYEVLAKTEARYKRRIEVFFPEREAVEQYVRFNGVNGFFESVTQRKACCEVRKTSPLKRALAGKSAWVPGLRREQAVTRANLTATARDDDHDLTKFNPLIDWTEADVRAYIRANDVPYNALHDRGYPSIGCAPCTRAITAGEGVRAGRWWWESPEGKECGLHVSPAGLIRASTATAVA
jgi:phosphoadenosine phosphosulfate reductase